MFKWYQESAVCYVYLSDFDSQGFSGHFTRCRWFTRGWTLQELIAPSHILFYDQDWVCYGFIQPKFSSRYHGKDLLMAVSRRTKIPSRILEKQDSLKHYATALRMSWAARRLTTRAEDMAYCLLGIFEINMPLIYGEGNKAFIRLQEEIIKARNDLTILTWQSAKPREYRGALASSPDDFVNASSIVQHSDYYDNPKFTMTNKGLRFDTTLPLINQRDGPIRALLSLNCHRREDPKALLGISLVSVSSSGSIMFVRDRPQELDTGFEEVPHTKQGTFYIVKHCAIKLSASANSSATFDPWANVSLH